LSVPLASTRSRSRTTSKEVLPCRTKTLHSSNLLAFKLTAQLEASVPAVVSFFSWLLVCL
jgi:hypothetical protein